MHQPFPRVQSRSALAFAPFFLAAFALSACRGDALDDERSAELAYLGLERMIEKSMDLAFDGFNQADSANIADQSSAGGLTGTMTIGGQVDQGASTNKGMRLWVALDEYSDPVPVHDDERTLFITYWTREDALELPALDLSLTDIPDGAIDGTLRGAFDMEGDIEGEVFLDVTFSGATASDGNGGTSRVPGSTSVIGTARSEYGRYDIDVVR